MMLQEFSPQLSFRYLLGLKIEKSLSFVYSITRVYNLAASRIELLFQLQLTSGDLVKGNMLSESEEANPQPDLNNEQ